MAATIPSFEITSITSNSVTIKITNPSGFAVRLYVRLEPTDGQMIVDEKLGYDTSYTKTITGLSASTTYAVNIAYSESIDSSNWTNVGLQTFQTLSGSGGGTNTVKLVYTNGVTDVGVAYINDEGQRVPSSGSEDIFIDDNKTFYVRKNYNIWLDWISFDSGYGPPWTITISGKYNESLSRVNLFGHGYDINTDIYPTGNLVITLAGTKQSKTRPDDWEWGSVVKKGAEIQITALDWNQFCARIGQFGNYLDLRHEPDFTVVKTGEQITAKIVNEAITEINYLDGHGTLPSPVASGDLITAKFFNDLKEALNTVP